jgi:hypothetical protein
MLPQHCKLKTHLRFVTFSSYDMLLALLFRRRFKEVLDADTEIVLIA